MCFNRRVNRLTASGGSEVIERLIGVGGSYAMGRNPAPNRTGRYATSTRRASA